MNKKIYASALFVVAAFVSTFASAQTAYDNSVTQAIIASAQTANAKVAAGGSSVLGNVLVIQGGATAPTDIPKDAEIIIRLPDGLNFDGNPAYSVGPAVATLGLTLKDATVFGDPTLDAPGIALFDTNADGGMDRAVVVVAAAAATNDTMTISINLKANADATAGVKQASIIVNGGLAVTQAIAEVVASLPEPLLSASGTQLSPADQNGTADLAVTTATITLTIPKGTLNGKTVTLTPAAGLKWATATSNITIAGVLTPISVIPLTPTGGALGPASSTTAISLAVQGGNAVTGLAADTQVVLMVDAVNVDAGAVGTRVVTVGGTAGISGSAALVSVLPNGSSAALTSNAPAPQTNVAVDIVAGATSAQLLPTIDISENFDQDAGGSTPGTDTITITAGAGLVFNAASVPTFTGAGWAATSTVTATTISVVVNANATTTIPVNLTIGGIMATAAADATGALTLAVGTPAKNNNKATAPNGDVITVANAVALGDVSVSISAAQVKTTGPGSAGVTSVITLMEGTYGSISTAAETQVQDAYVRVTPSANATITAVTTAIVGYPVAATTPTFSACVAEANVTTGAWLCEISAESTAITPTTSAVTVTVGYSAKATAAIGSTIDMALDGNARVDGSVTVANVGVTTTASKGVVPDLTPGDTEASNLAPVTIKENFTGAVTLAKEFRLIGPAGVAFQDAAGIAAQSPGVATATITATFAPNDTLVMTTAATSSITFTPKAVIASSLSDWLSFDIVDGNIDGLNKAGITGESVMIAYADGTLGAVDAGDDVSVSTGFSAVNAVEGGLAPYTVKSSAATIATATVNGSNVTVKGVSAGIATITVTDGLGGTDTYLVTAGAGAAQPVSTKAPKSANGDVGDASFTAGASKDGGATYENTFTTADDVTIVGTVNVNTADQGTDGAIHVVILAKVDGTSSFSFVNEDGNFEAWDLTVSGLGAAEVATPLAASHSIVAFSGTMAAGTYKVALAYTTESGTIVYTGNAVEVTVTE